MDSERLVSELDLSGGLGRLVSASCGRALLRSGSCSFLGFGVRGRFCFAVLSPWGGPSPVGVLLGAPGVPLAGVVGPARAWVLSRPSAVVQRGPSGGLLC